MDFKSASQTAIASPFSGKSAAEYWFLKTCVQTAADWTRRPDETTSADEEI
jgi:hypothetical protein